MPEGPEVQTVLNALSDRIRGARIARVTISHPKLAANMDPDEFSRALCGQTILDFTRIGKYLILVTDDYDWVIHLRMEGKFYVLDFHPEPHEKHMHAFFDLEDGRCVVYRDVRKFGRMYLYPRTKDLRSLPVFAKIGPDALEPMSPETFRDRLKKRRAIKQNLLDQEVIAGIGNIYADEILFASGIHPETPAGHLDEAELARILDSTRRILSQAIRDKGTTIRSYTSSLGVQGGYQDRLQVHMKEGEPCPVCRTPIIKTRVGQRGTYLCPHCQVKK